MGAFLVDNVSPKAQGEMMRRLRRAAGRNMVRHEEYDFI